MTCPSWLSKTDGLTPVQIIPEMKKSKRRVTFGTPWTWDVTKEAFFSQQINSNLIVQIWNIEKNWRMPTLTIFQLLWTLYFLAWGDSKAAAGKNNTKPNMLSLFPQWKCWLPCLLINPHRPMSPLGKGGGQITPISGLRLSFSPYFTPLFNHSAIKQMVFTSKARAPQAAN